MDALRPPPIENPDDDVGAAPVFADFIARCLSDPDKDGEDDPVWGELNPRAVPGFLSSNLQRVANKVRYVSHDPISQGFDPPDEATAAQAFLVHGETHATTINEIGEALARPRADFLVPYGDFSSPIPGLISLGSLSKFLHSHGQAALLHNRSDLARANAIAMLRLSRHVSGQHTLMNVLIGMVVHDLAIALIHEGLATGKWSEADLGALGDELESPWIEEAFLSAVRMERASLLVSFKGVPEDLDFDWNPLESWVRVLLYHPDLRKGWYFDNLEHYCRTLQETVLEDNKGARLTRHIAPPLRDAPMILAASSDPRDQFRFYMETFRHGWAESSFAMFTGIRMKALRTRVLSDHARIAVALALHQNKHSQFPADLDSLIFPGKAPLPLDPFTGVAYVYRALGGADYLLYSPGPDLRDDGGLLRHDYEKGDWVWRLHLAEDFDFDAYRQR